MEYVNYCYYIFFAINFLVNEFTIIQDSKELFFQLEGGNEEINEKERRNFALLFEGIKTKLPKTEDDKIREKNKKKREFIESFISIRNQKKTKKRNSVFRFPQFNKEKSILFSNNNSILENNKKNKNDNYSKKNINANIISVSPFDNSSNSVLKNKSNILLLNKKQNFCTDIKINSMKSKSDKKYGMSHAYISQEDKGNDDYGHFSQNLNKFISEKKQNIKLESIPTKYLEKYISPCYFLISLFTKKSRIGKIFYIIKKFRKKLLSEEHIFRTHIFLYYFKQFFDVMESEKIDITELYNYL